MFENIFSGRFFAVIALLFVAVILNCALLLVEKMPEKLQTGATEAVTDPLKNMKFTAAKRQSNLEDFGLTDSLVDRTLKRITKVQADDLKNSQKESLFLKSIRENAEVGGLLCPNEKIPPRYAATGILLQQSDVIRKPLDPGQVRQKLVVQEWYDEGTVRAVYNTLEITPERSEDATALGIAALLLGKEMDVANQSGEFAGGLLGGPSMATLMAQHPEIENDLVEYFAMMHLLIELANDPANEFCGGKRKVSPNDEEGDGG